MAWNTYGVIALAFVFSACGGDSSNDEGAGGSAGSGGGTAAGGASGSGGAVGGSGGAVGGSGGAIGGSGGVIGGSGGVGGAPGVACGADTCEITEACVYCDPTNPNTTKICSEGFGNACPGGGFPLRLWCDGHEDCSETEQCQIIEGSTGTYAQCLRPNACQLDCSCPFSFPTSCRTLADCPACATSCEPYRWHPTAPEYPVNVCRW